MKCTYCNQEIEDGSVFCELCGMNQNEKIVDILEETSDTNELNKLDKLDKLDEVVQGSDGIYRWVYELNMWTNPTILITLLKIMILASLVPTIFVTILGLFESGMIQAIEAFMKVGGMLGIIMLVLLAVAYPLVAIMNGGKYCVAFEMDERGVKHIQMEKQFKKSQVLSMITMLAGALSNNPTVTGAGLLANAKKSSYSQFSKVKSVIPKHGRNVIYVNESFERNQIYVEKENFEAVYEYIIRHCKKINNSKH